MLQLLLEDHALCNMVVNVEGRIASAAPSQQFSVCGPKASSFEAQSTNRNISVGCSSAQRPVSHAHCVFAM